MPTLSPLEQAWQTGAASARLGLPVSACPHAPANYEFVTWHNGWAHTTWVITHEMAKAEPQQDYEEF